MLTKTTSMWLKPTGEWQRISLGASSSRYVVHFGDGHPSRPEAICGSRNDTGKQFKIIETQGGGGAHVNCTKCLKKKDALRQEAYDAQIKADAKAAVDRMAKMAKTKQPLVTAVPAQRNGVVVGASPSFLSPPLAPKPDSYDDDEYDREDDFYAPVARKPAPASAAVSVKSNVEGTTMTATVEPTAQVEATPPATTRVSNPMVLDIGELVKVDVVPTSFTVTFSFPEQPSIVITGIEAAGEHAALVAAYKKLTFSIDVKNQVSYMGGGE